MVTVRRPRGRVDGATACQKASTSEGIYKGHPTRMPAHEVLVEDDGNVQGLVGRSFVKGNVGTERGIFLNSFINMSALSA